MTKYINLTKKTISIVKSKDGITSYTQGDDIGPSSTIATVDWTTVGFDDISRVDIKKQTTKNLPDFVDGTIYIVYNDVRIANSDRKDLICSRGISFSHKYDKDGSLISIDHSNCMYDSILVDLGDSRPPKKDFNVDDLFPWLKK